MQARCAAGRREAVPAGGGESEIESELHNAIVSECKLRLWPVVHSRTDQRTTTAKGVPDFVIFAERGLVFAVECKTRKDKLTPEQIGWRVLLERNGHKYAVVRSFTEFQDVVENWLRWTPKTGPLVKMDFWSAGAEKADDESQTQTA